MSVQPRTTAVRRDAPLARHGQGLVAAALLGLAVGGCSLVRDFGEFQPASDAGAGDPGDATPDAPVADTGPPPLTRDDYNTALSRVLCRRSTFCEPKGGFAELLLQLTCAESVVSDPSLQQDPLLQSLLFSTRLFGGPMATLSPEDAADCLRAIDNNDCNILSKPIPAACLRVWRGGVPNGGICQADTDCRVGRCALEADGAAVCGGTCVAFTPDGEPCAEDLECIPGRVCREDTCGPPGRDGDSCASNFDCGSELWCPQDEDVCRPQPTAGGACARRFFGEDPCASLLVCADDGTGVDRCKTGQAEGDDCSFDNPCAPGLRCDDDTNRCIFVAAPGDECASTANCPLLLECVNRAGRFRCVPRPALGEACSPLLPCAVGVCGDDDVCVFLPDGAPCTGDDSVTIRECQGFCDTDAGTCRDRLSAGAACDEDFQCQNGAFCDPDAAECTACVR